MKMLKVAVALILTALVTHLVTARWLKRGGTPPVAAVAHPEPPRFQTYEEWNGWRILIDNQLGRVCYAQSGAAASCHHMGLRRWHRTTTPPSREVTP